MSNFGTGSTNNEDLMFSLGLDGLTLVDQLDSTEQKVGESLKKISGHFKALKTEIDSAGASDAFKRKISGLVGPVSTLTTELRALVSQLRQVNSLLTGMSGAGAPSIIKATGNASAAATVAAGKAAAASISATGRAAAAATAAAGKASAAATVATAKANALASDAATRATAAADRAARASTAAAKRMALSGQTLNQQFQQTGGYLRNISTVLSTIGLGGGIFALIYGFKQLIKDGIDINSQVEQAKISLAAEVVASAKLVEVDGERVQGLRAILAVQGQVGQIVGQLRTDALFVNGTFEDLLGIAQSITPQVTRMGGSLSQVHRLTQLTGIAASVLNVEFKTAQTGLSQLLNGNVVGRNSFVRRLPIPVDELKAGLKDVNGRAEFLIKTLQRLEDAGPLILTSFKGAFESMKDLMQQLSGRAFEPLQKRLQSGFNSFIGANVTKSSDGTMKYSKELEATILRVSRLVDTLLAQIILVARQLFSKGSRSFLDIAEETLPKIIAGFGSLLSVLATVGSFLADHAGLVLKLVGYYLTFNIVTGLFNSFAGIIMKVNGALTALQALMVQAGSSTMSMTGAVTMLTGALKALATKFIIGLLVVAVMEMVSNFISARQAAADMKLALEDLNNLNFDTAIGQIRKLTQEIREGQSMWSRAWSGNMTKQNASGINTITAASLEKSFDVLDSLGIKTTRNLFQNMAVLPGSNQSVPGLHKGAITDPVEIANSARKIGQGIELIRRQQDALQKEAQTASDKRREEIKTELGNYAKKNEALRSSLTLLRENMIAVQALSATEEGRKQLGGTNLALYAKAGEDVTAVEAGLNLPAKTKVTPNTVAAPADEDAARRLLRNETALVNALEQVSQASARVLDRTNQRQQSEMDLWVAKHIMTVQQASDREIQIAKDTAAAKIGVQEKLFEKLNDNKLVDLAGAKSALGMGGGGPLTFEQLKGVSEEELAKALAGMQGRAETGNKTDQAKFTKQIHDLEILGKIIAAVHTEEERLGNTIAENSRRREKADEDAINTGNEQAAVMAERAAQLDVEQAKLFDIGQTVEERIDREKRLTAEMVKQAKADVDRKAQKERNDNTERTNWTPEKKAEANNVITANAEREKKFIAAKEEIALAQRIIDIKDQELSMGQTGTQIREIELGTLRQILGAENPLVVARENELILAKANTLELQAQARYAAAASLKASGQSTAARLATNAGDVLMAQATALRMETKNYLDTIAGSMNELSGLLGRFGNTVSDFAHGIGGLFSEAGKFSKINLGETFNASKGESKGVLGFIKGAAGVAGPIASVASAALGMFQTFFSIFQAGWQKLLDEAHDKIQEALDASLGSLRAGRSTLKTTIDDLKNQMAHVEDKYPKPKGGSWWEWLVSPLWGAAGTIYTNMSNSSRQKAIDEDKVTISRQIAQLAQDAQEALYTLEHDTLPALRVTPAMREFESSLEKIRKELQGLAGTPGITQGDLNEMFNIRIADLARDLQAQQLDQRQEYLDVLKHEKDLKQQLVDLDKEAASVQDEYKSQRAQILGLATRELSKSEQLAKLAKDKQEKLDAIAQRKLDVQTELDYVDKQKSAYEAIYGVVTDIGAYEISIQDELLSKTKERLTSLSDFFKEVQAWMAGPMWNFITDNGKTTSGGNPYALPVVLVNPQPITNPDAPNPGITGDQVNYNMNGDIYVSGNLSASEAKQSFLDAWRAFNQENAAKGLAYGNV